MVSATSKPAINAATGGISSSTRNPWWIVLAAVLGTVVSNGPLLQFSFGVFVKPLAEAFQSSRATISAAVLVGFVVTGLCTPFAGRLIDKHGVRPVLLPGIVLFALSIAALGFAPAAPLPFIVMYGLAGVFAAAQSPLPYAKAVAGAFEKRRGLALGCVDGGRRHPARPCCRTSGRRSSKVMGGARPSSGWVRSCFSVPFPAVLLLLREPVPVAMSTRVSVPGLTARQAFGTRSFWYLAIVFFAVVAACGGTIAHIASILTDRGVAPQIAAGAISAAGISLIVGRLLAGYLLDRFFAPYVALVFIVTPLLGLVLLLLPAPPRSPSSPPSASASVWVRRST